MSFCTAINCMDGRVQLPAIEYLKNKYNTDHVDMITEPGPVAILAGDQRTELIPSIVNRTQLSVDTHHSKLIAIIAHYDCVGNPIEKDHQLIQLKKSVELIKTKFPQTKIIGLWIDKNWDVNEIIN